MTIQKTFSISGIGKYLPQNQITSNDLEKQLNLPIGWIKHRLGVDKRYQATTETNGFMGAQALRKALNKANLKFEALDCLISAAATFDYVIPNRSLCIKKEFQEAAHCDFPCIDINTVCTSFISAIAYASGLIETGKYQHVAIVSSEISSKGLNPNDPKTYSLFGDAAVAIILSRSEAGAGGLIHHQQKNYIAGAMLTHIKGGGNAFHPKDFSYHPELHSFSMEGKQLLRLAKQHLPAFIEDFFKQSPVKLSEVDWIIPHQASKMGFKLLHAIFGEAYYAKIVDILEDYGNCIASSIPLGIDQLIENNKLKDGNTCLVIGTAAGLSIEAVLIKYTKS